MTTATKRGHFIGIMAIAAAIHCATERWWKGLPELGSKKLTDKAKKIQGIVSAGGFGCRTKYVLEIMSVLLGEKLVDSRSGRAHFRPMIMIVPTGNDNSHNYAIGKTALFTGYSKCGGTWDAEDDIFFRFGSSPAGGNHMTPSRKYVRPATRREILTYLRQAPPWLIAHLRDVIKGKEIRVPDAE